MKLFVPDTNIFLRYLLKDVPDQALKAKEYIEAAKKQEIKLYLSQIVIIEIEFALRKLYQFEKQETVNFLGTLVIEPFFDVEDRDVLMEGLSLFNKTNVELVDALLFAKAHALGGEVLSFDKGYGKIK